MEKEEFKPTDLDYLIGDHHLQMIKAALPYVHVQYQKFLSLMVKSNELMRTAQLFQEGTQGEMGICSIEQDKASPVEMLNAMKPYGTQQEQDIMEVIINILQGFQIRRNFQESAPAPEVNSNPSPAIIMEKLRSILPPDQQAKLDNIQLIMQTMQAFT